MKSSISYEQFNIQLLVVQPKTFVCFSFFCETAKVKSSKTIYGSARSVNKAESFLSHYIKGGTSHVRKC